jgi:hypothetical protein
VTDTERIKELEKLIEWHKQDTHDAMEWKRELEAEMLNNAKTAQLIIDGLEAKLEKAVGALRELKSGLLEDGYQEINALVELCTETIHELGEAR